ncbi:MAG: CPBP family intramembrane metalloprotease, partial [Cyanobacteria bacterium]|nr:CPBP family intramembrane metalloprotease [Cyanobacteriota bacterium]
MPVSPKTQTPEIDPFKLAVSPMPWGGTVVIVSFLLAYLILPFTGQSFLQLLFPMWEENQMIIGLQFIPLICWWVIFWILQKIYTLPALSFLGLSPLPSWKNLLKYSTFAGIGVLAIVGGLGLLYQASHFTPEAPYEGLSETRLQILSTFAILLAPLLEELVFRGFLYASLRGYYTGWPCILLSSLIFSLCHTSYQETPWAFLNVFFIGALFA